jgi:hypothetical protein
MNIGSMFEARPEEAQLLLRAWNSVAYSSYIYIYISGGTKG